jgi:hypothetical protein
MTADQPKQEFEVELDKFDGAVSFVVPFDVQQVWGTRAQVRVRGTLNGHPYRASIAPYGGQHYMVLRKEIREGAGLKSGDRVKVVMEVDTEERTVDVPDDFQQALDQNPQAKAIFEDFAYTPRKEYVHWIESAKKAETRASRIQKAVEQIAQGKKFS